jgi:transposase-like protein
MENPGLCSRSKETKLTGKEPIIRELLSKKVSHSAIARILDVNRGTLTSFVKRHQFNGREQPPLS